MNALVLIDTSAWIFTLGPHPNPDLRERVSYLVEQNLACITSPVVFELLSGTKSEYESVRLNAYLSTIHPFPLQIEEWNEAADWTAHIRKKGLKVKTVDALIAYKAVKHKLTLLHADADMDRIAKKSSLTVESYVDEIRRMSR